MIHPLVDSNTIKTLPVAIKFALSGICVLSLSPALSPAAFGQALPLASDIDWVNWDFLSTAQQSQTADNCCGMYVQPEIPAVPEDPLFIKDSTYVDANQIEYEQSGEVVLTGNVRTIQEGRVITSNSGTYDQNLGIFDLDGNVQLRERNLLLVGEHGTAFQTTDTVTFNESSYVMHDSNIRGTAQVIVYTDADGIITIDNGKFSRCEPGNNTWAMQAKKITLNQESGRGVARNATLKIKDVPLLYTPWISFPINDERMSGFLAPSFGTTNSGGFEITTPYYFNLAPNYDATYSPRLMVDRGLQHGLEFRHLGTNTQNNISVNYLSSDKLFDPVVLNQIEEARLANDNDLLNSLDSAPKEKRWLANLDHRGRISNHWSSFINYNAVSDDDYFQDFGSRGLRNATPSYLESSAYIRYSDQHWQMTSLLRNYQVIDPLITPLAEPENMLPQITLDGNFSTEFNVNYGVSTEYTYFDRDLDVGSFAQNIIDQGRLVRGGRLSIEPEISYTWSTPGIFITPKVEFLYSEYQLEHQLAGTTENPSRGVFRGSIDSGLIFDRKITLFDTEFTQTLEPRLFYVQTEYEDQDDLPLFDSAEPTFSSQQLFRLNRFSGRDRISDTDQLTVGISTKFLGPNGREKAKASIGQIFYFADRQVSLRGNLTEQETRNTSSIASELSYKLNDNWNIRSYLEWNSTDNSFDGGNFQFQYQSDIKHILNFGLQFRDENRSITANGIDPRIAQSNISTTWPINDRWGILAKFNYDHANNRNLDSLAGFEFNSCCWNTRIVYREWMDTDSLNFYNDGNYDYGLFLQFELKGLGNLVGGNVQNILANSILGYPAQ